MNNTKVKSITCTNCAAPLNLFGGHKIQSITCSSCGSCLNCHDEYKMIAQFKNLQRPKMPIKIGAIGKLKNIEFVVTGILITKEIDEDGMYLCQQYQLFSPTHGYAWLIRDDQLNYSFMREVKDMPDIFINVPDKIGKKFNARDLEFQIQDSGNETICYVEGELTWIAKIGDKSFYTTAVSSPYIYEISKCDNELEFSFGEMITVEEVYQAFQLKGNPIKPLSKHIASPPSSVDQIKTIGKLFTFLCAFITIALIIFGSGKNIYKEFIYSSEYSKGVTKELHVTDPDTLFKIKLHCPLSNAWTYFEITISKNNHDFFTIGKEISYYHGYSGGESWSEGSKNASAYFRLPEKGMYQLHIAGQGARGNQNRGKLQDKTLKISITEGVIVSRYFIILTIFMIIFCFFKELGQLTSKINELSDQ